MSDRNALPLVSVIILNFNGKRYLEKCLSSVLDARYPNFEVILVDNASTDGSLDFVQRTFGNDHKLKMVRNSKNFGYSLGNNIGFEHARGKYIVFLNNDTSVDPLWLTALVDIMEKDGTIGLAQSMILKIDGQEILTAGYLLDSYLQDAFALGENVPAISCLSLVFEVSFASGAAMMTRRELIDEVGLFDPKLPFFCDDTLLSLKTWLAGKRVVTVAGSKVSHVGGGTWKGDPYFLAYHILKGRISLILATYRRFGELATGLFSFTVCLFKNSISLMKGKNQAVFWANTRAMSWAFRNLRYMWANRLRYWGKAKVSPKSLIRNFIRLEIPASLYVVPSRLRMVHCERGVKEYFAGTINQGSCHGAQILPKV